LPEPGREEVDDEGKTTTKHRYGFRYRPRRTDWWCSFVIAS